MITNLLFFGTNLVVGLGLILWAWQLASRFKYQFLHYFKFYQLAWVVYGLLNFVGQYALYQVPDLTPHERYLIFQVASVLPELAWSLFMYLLLYWACSLAGWRRPRWLPWAFWGLQSILVAVLIVNIAVITPSGRHSLNLFVGRCLDWAYYIQLILLPAVLLIGSARITLPKRRRLAFLMGAICLVCYLVPATLILSQRAFAGGTSSYLVSQSLVFLGIAIPPLALLHVHLVRHGLEEATTVPHETLAKSLEALGLNRREREIAVLVAQGLTNDEVADALFIAVKTVKNNVWSIYRKAKIRNRVELAKLVLGGQTDTENKS